MSIVVQDCSKYLSVLTAEAINFVGELVETFSPRVQTILATRAQQQALFDSGALPFFLLGTGYIRQGTWKIAPVPADIQDRRVEITGPVERKMIINALNSGANVFMADFEDSCSPTWDNMMQGQINLMDAVRRTISFTNEAGKLYELNPKTATLFVRPRGWHLVEKHFQINDTPVPAALIDFGLYFFHNAKELLLRGSAPYFYLPKMESHLEARLWNDIFVWSQNKLGISIGAIKATCLIETLPAAFEMEEMLYELKDHSAGLNMGRWDYIFSFIKKLANNPKFILPNRSQITMDKGFLAAYCKLLVHTCHKRGAHAMGGMAAQIPIKSDPEANETAMNKVRSDKLREVKLGCDGTWVAHPGLLPIAKQIFDEHMPSANQLSVVPECKITTNDLLTVPEGDITETELRNNVRVGIRYMHAWLNGNGCVPLYNLMEDAATAEISRAQVWQWMHHQVPVSGSAITPTVFLGIVNEEMDKIKMEMGMEATSRELDTARDLFVKLSTSERFEEFLTIPAYEMLP